MPNEYIGVETLDAYMRNGSIDRKLDLDTLHRLPAADVVEVVQCKDCEQYVAGELATVSATSSKRLYLVSFTAATAGRKEDLNERGTQAGGVPVVRVGYGCTRVARHFPRQVPSLRVRWVRSNFADSLFGGSRLRRRNRNPAEQADDAGAE